MLNTSTLGDSNLYSQTSGSVDECHGLANHSPSAASPDLQELFRRLEQIQTALDLLASQRLTKDFYSTEEVAEILGKAPFTVREWSRLGRINAEKRQCGRGASREWMISKEELDRLQSEGLLPRK